MTGGMAELKQRIGDMESEVTHKVGSALELIRTVDARQKTMGRQMDAMQEKLEEQVNRGHTQERHIQDILKRLEALEAERAAGQPTMWRQTGLGAPEEDGGPAVSL